MKERVNADWIKLNSTLRYIGQQIMLLLAVSVILVVFWCLKLTGITLAGEAFCGHEEHVHDENCVAGSLICVTEELQGHIHEENCYSPEEKKVICDQEECEGHTHGETCYLPEEIVLICEQEECEGHSHDELCYFLAESTVICELEEGENHTHEELCYSPEESILICEQEERVSHTHEDVCYLVQESMLICELEECEGHIHEDACFVIEESTLICEQEEVQGHIHDNDCYESMLVCTKEEHIHVESCYSNINEDLETASEWEASIEGVALDGTSAENIVSIARSQLGYQESTLNFEVDAQGVRRGITRFGQWYGNPYGDWSAMFALFCLEYAGIDDIPANAGPESLRLAWENAGLYVSAQDYMPQVGNLLFLSETSFAEAQTIEDEQTIEEQTIDEESAVQIQEESLNENGIAMAVAIITEVAEEHITIIQGNVNDAVVEYSIEIGNGSILGYGRIQESSPYAVMTLRSQEMRFVAKTIAYNTNIFNNNRAFLIYTQKNGEYYAIDGSGNAVPVSVPGDGSIYSESERAENLLWTISRTNSNYVIENLGTGRFLHPYNNGNGDTGVTTTTGWTTSLYSTYNGVLLQNSAYARLNNDNTAFVTTQYANEASAFQFGYVDRYTIWLDGTNGNLMSLHGSSTESLQVAYGQTITLPSQWKSPEKYSYVLRGWYDVKNGRYYSAGAEVVIEEELLFYADWVAATYDIGQMNGYVVDSVNTSEFITTHVFDYNSLFNVLSMSNNYSGGSETRWTLVESGKVQSTQEDTLNFIFVDYDNTNDPGAISYPVGRNQANGVDYSRVTSGLYNNRLTNRLFNKDLELAGKHYLGTGNYLFQYGSDPNDAEHYGYFYYDSMLNAASYHQTNGRFYIYDYLERTVDSANNDSYSDFLPLNSPYANTNGKATGTYYYNGVHNEYVGTPHLSYDTKYSDNDNSPNRIGTNFWFGMSIDIDFYLSSKPGTRDSEGVLANQSIVGKEMVFEFSGDDDVWVLIDGQLVLDIGGIHEVETGSINFSTGDVIVDGVKTGSVNYLSPGSHKVTMYYLERGSSMSNFKLRFNLSTRYTMNLRKEDTLTAHLLDGAQFAFYTDEACTQPAELWDSRDAHERGESPRNVFTVTGGSASIWGFAAGNTYYFEEIRGPNNLNGVAANGVVRMQLNNHGTPDYEIVKNSSGELTVGYMVHGYKVNEDTQEAYLVITNTDAIGSEPTEVYVEKVWSDNKNHTSDSVIVYLRANGNQIQSVTLNQANNWKHTWTNLPKTDAAGNKVSYTVHESTVPGYVGKVEKIDAPASGGGTVGGLTSADSFANGETYLLYTRFGYIGAANNKILLEADQATALGSNATQWTAVVNSDGTVTLTNKNGQTLYYDNYTFKASSSPGTYKKLRYANGKLYCYIDHGGWNETLYPIDNDNVASNVTYNSVFYTTGNETEAMKVTLQKEVINQPSAPSEEGICYRITNIPAGEATISLQVNKKWNLGQIGQSSMYEGLNIQMRLLADGKDGGLVGNLNLRNGWSYTFKDLPKYNNNGQEIIYTVEEINLPNDWHVEYGPVTSIDGSQTDYEATVTNIYHMTVELPTTGSIGRHGYTMLGLLIMLTALVWYCRQRHKCERRKCQ